MRTQPASQATELNNEINQWLNSHKLPDELTLKKLQKQAEQVLTVDYAKGYELLGCLSTLNADHQSVLSYFDKAIKRDGSHVDIYINYARALENLVDFKLAAEVSLSALKRFPKNQELLNQVFRSLWLSGQYNQFEKLSSSYHIEINQEQKKILDFIRKYKLDETIVQAIISIASQSAKKFTAHLDDNKYSLQEEEDAVWLTQDIYLLGMTDEDLLDLTFYQIELLTEADFPGSTSNKFLVSFHGV